MRDAVHRTLCTTHLAHLAKDAKGRHRQQGGPIPAAYQAARVARFPCPVSDVVTEVEARRSKRVGRSAAVEARRWFHSLVAGRAAFGYCHGMTYHPAYIRDDQGDLPRLPGWAAPGRADTAESVAFRSGAALTVLDRLVSGPAQGVPVTLLASRLSLSAATATSKIEGRMAREADIRDAYHLASPGAARGPDGDLLAFWRAGARVPVRGQAGIAGAIGPDLAEDLAEDLSGGLAGWLRAGEDRTRACGPLAGCVSVLRSVLEADGRAERAGCLLSDVVLARALGWAAPLPVTAQRLTKAMLRDLAADKPGAALAAQARILASIEDTIRLARDLAPRAAALRAVAPKLRAKGSAAAVELFLSEEAVAPASMLSPRIRGTATPMSDRAARRLCERLVGLGVARELTGRASFRLYGIAP